MERLHVMPGYLCNFTCSHCVNDSGPERLDEMTIEEELTLASHIKLYRPSELAFTGGEPFLYVKKINRLIDAHPSFAELNVQITTNGYFAALELEQVVEKLRSFRKITHLLLSFDRYRTKLLSKNQIARLSEACNLLDIKFQVSLCISKPIDLLFAAELVKLKLSVIYQKVESSGRAKSNQLGYEYSSFEPESLVKKCPNLESPSFIAGRGFSICCSNLIFNGPAKPGISHATLLEHYSSSFYLRMNTLTFGEQLQELGIKSNSLNAEHSAPCSLCEHITSLKNSNETDEN